MHRPTVPNAQKNQPSPADPPLELPQGDGPLFGDPDPDAARAFFRDKSRMETDKRMSAKQAVESFIAD
ncbi:MAG: hypothetical protein K9K34_08660, partial [Desulfarculaceae bacterium]|nr:hypothetical protein [Desulfarculaceae bacterium]